MRSSGWCRAGPGLVLVLLAGCGHVPGIDRALLADHDPASHRGDVSARYVVHCPDALSFRIDGRPDWSGDRLVGADGRVWLAPGVSVRVDGLTVPQIAARTSRQLDLLPECVEVTVAAFNSQQIYLFGEVSGLQQAVPYQGPETVLELLQRAGGVTTGAAPRDVQVVRSHVADGKPPEVFHVDLHAILFRRDNQTNVPLEPFDQVHIGQSRTSRFGACLPPVVRPAYDWLCGTHRPEAGPPLRAPAARAKN